MSRTKSAALGCGQLLRGIPVCEGVAIGPVFLAAEPMPEVTRQRIQASDIEAERLRFDEAVARSQKQIHKLRARLTLLPSDSQDEIATLLDAYQHMLGASRLLRGTRSRIAERLVSAETAVTDEAQLLAASLANMGADNDSARRQADEVREIARRLVRNLTRAPFRSFGAAPQGAILIADSLRPADAALINPARIAGVAAEEGGTDGHTAILLRALGVPAVLGVPGLLAQVRLGLTVIVDGQDGTLQLGPDAAGVAEARRSIVAYARQRQRLERLRRLPAETLDGEAIELHANLELPAELPMVGRSGASGIGLVRSEFLFMNRETLPDEDEQAEIYRGIVDAMAGEPVTIRVLDWGGEKDLEAVAGAGLVPPSADSNPALGLRGLRLLLRQEALFETQLAAIIRASAGGPVRVLLPMVTNAAEIRAARTIYERAAVRVRARLPAVRVPPLGVMIETPAAALAADGLARVSDFFALGTNDLTMYTLAVDRAEATIAPLYDPLHPAVLKLIQASIETARRHRIPISLCGEIAGDPRAAPLLVGLGLRSFSMAAANVPRVKQAIRGTTAEACVRLAWAVMQAEAEQIPGLLDSFGR